MKIRDILNAVLPMRKLMNLDLTAKDAYKVARLSTKIEEELNTFNKLVAAAKEKHRGNDEELEKALDEIADLETEQDIKYIEIQMPEGKLTAQDMLHLMPFVAFREDE